jgi:hypothetical protein
VLHEIKAVSQERGAGSRRWFESDGLELVVWFDATSVIVGFQLCYDLGAGEHALTWRAHNGFIHSRVDAGEETPLANLTPVLEPDGAVPWSEIARLFEQRCGNLDAALREAVRQRLIERAGSGREA